jgi:hypothetical protein
MLRLSGIPSSRRALPPRIISKAHATRPAAIFRVNSTFLDYIRRDEIRWTASHA